MKTKKQFLLFLLCFFFGGSLIAQQNTVGTGGEATGTGGTVSYTVGQIDYTAQSGANGTISQGVQQAAISVTNNLTENTADFSVLLYPNPTVAELHVDLKEVAIDHLNYVMVDATGKQVKSSEVTSKALSINMVDMSRGSYFLHFIQNGKTVGSYTVVKK